MEMFITHSSAPIQAAKPPVKAARDDATAGASGKVGARRIGVPPSAAAAPEPPPADHKLGPGQALPPPPWYRRPGILIAAAALFVDVGIVVSQPGEPGTAPGGTTGMSTPWSASFSLMATGWWEPPPEPPPAAPSAAEPPAAAPPAAAPRRAAPRTAELPAAEPPAAAPPPPPPPELKLRFDDPVTAAFVSITNNADKPAVGCVLKSVAVAGPGTLVNVPEQHFTVTGSEEARLPAGGSLGPATGSTWHTTVTCENGLSTSYDGMY